MTVSQARQHVKYLLINLFSPNLDQLRTQRTTRIPSLVKIKSLFTHVVRTSFVQKEGFFGGVGVLTDETFGGVAVAGGPEIGGAGGLAYV